MRLIESVDISVFEFPNQSTEEMADVADKLAYFQAITGLEDPDLCTKILAAHGWDLELAISSFTTTTTSSSGANQITTDDNITDHLLQSEELPPPPPGLAWKLITLPVSVISRNLGLISGAIGLDLRAAGASSSRSAPLRSATTEATDFVAAFERDYGSTRPNFVAEGFMDALQRSRNLFQLLFVYLHSPIILIRRRSARGRSALRLLLRL
ncbi:hypothetical protein OROGR_006137 [Orobanche gracilis]